GEDRLQGNIWIGASTQGRTHMTEFVGRTAVVTGGGSGMGRELVRQLVAEACNVAMCDVSPTDLAETQRLCEAAGLPQGLRVTTHIADVADRTQVERFRHEVADRHQTDKIHLFASGVAHYANFRRERPGEINHLYEGRGVYFDDPN